MNFREACKPYFNHENLIKNKPEDPDVDGNSYMYTSIYYIYLKLLGISNPQDRIDLDNLIRRWEVMPGVLARAGDFKQGDQQNQDDYYYVLAACYMYDLDFPERVYQHGVDNFWVFDNFNKSFKFTNWWWPLMGFKPFVECTSGRSFCEMRMVIDVWFTTHRAPEDTSGRLIDSLKLVVPSSERVKNIVRRDVNKHYPNGYQDLFGMYFKPVHPFARWAPKALNKLL